ncbi:DUF1642 domain-containing protein [Streptococcus sp.]|uniref:DUF1642 domain-containing protein n=1 Tax=Streptococcus sp. TaxID=1306 RepID=UPI000ED596F5|nr:DUF1642 domain-containing protein [Streptococcus sp.]MCO4545421.1 hypothetical protein [Streptococcus infantarius subsp. infantarius]MCO4589048.1 hypothetical protein [Streptococcus infantarius subsp. infantarius]HAK38763.1 hypothetical protein [Streptococcus sp.]
MNKQEAIERLEEKKSSFNAWENLVRNRALDDALDIVKQLDEPEKTVVPQFVADWYEENKYTFEYSLAQLINDYYKSAIEDDNLRLWFGFDLDNDKPIETLVNMHQFGYKVYEKKLYTVEIPNPNEPDSGHIVLHKDEHNKVYIDWHYEDDWKLLKSLKLTEAEIKEDFAWAWQFAKEVEDD